MLDRDRFLKEHGIREDVWRGRPHIPYDQSDVDAVMAPETHFAELPKAARRAISDWVRKAPGIAMARHPVPASPLLPDIAAELRPEWPIMVKGPSWHEHGDLGEKTREHHETRRKTTREEILRGGFVYKDIEAEPEIEGVQEAVNVPITYVFGFGDDHFELDESPPDISRVAGRHYHVHTAKYVFSPKEKTRRTERFEPHVHAVWWPEFTGKQPGWWGILADTIAGTMDREAQRAAKCFYHLLAHRDSGQPVPDWDQEHQHTFEVTVKDESNPLTRERLDMHPMAVPLVKRARCVYFVIEGCLKADAVLSAVLERGSPETVFSVPSVTLWQAEELSDFACEHLRGQDVVIVADSDWVSNDRVREQAFRLREVLRSEQVAATVAAPTPEPGACRLHGKGGKPAAAGAKRGVDDFLADGCSLDELVEIGRVPPTLDRVKDWIRSRRRRGPWEQAVESRDYPVLRWLTILAREDGTTQVTPHALAEYLGWADARSIDPASAQKEVNRALLSLRNAEIIESDGSLALKEQQLLNLQRKRRPDLFWKDSPTLTIHPDFRANQPARTIGPR